MTHSRRCRRRSGGFTLIEVMLVLVILMVIGGMAVLAYKPIQEGANKRGAAGAIEALTTPLEMYAIDVGSYPTTEQGLDALYEAPTDLADPSKWGGRYIRERLENDPWGNPFQYEYPGNHDDMLPDIWSLGADGIDGTDDDITSWKEDQ